MISFRGDAHKFYLKLRRAQARNQPINELKEIAEIDDVRRFYQHLDNPDLIKIRYRMLKEHHGTGMIPLLLSALPWLLFIFSKQLQSFLFGRGNYLWIGFVLLYAFVTILSIIVHYREKAWASIHIEIIQDLLKEREKNHDKT